MITPLSHRWFLAHKLTNIRPWYFIDEQFGKSFRSVFLRETGGMQDVYPFARRQDCDDVAFFLIKDGKIIDEVIVYHLTYVSDEWSRNKDWIGKTPWKGIPFIQWVCTRAIPDIEDWMSEEDLTGADN